MNKVITISRQFGSGGREIGAKLAEKLGIPFYDNELITRAAKESGFAEAVFENAEKKATSSLLYSIAMGMSSYGSQDLGFSHLSLDDRIYLAQSNVIRKVAEEGPCIIIGRCADYILRDRDDCLHIFIHADNEHRAKRILEKYGPTDKTTTQRIKDKDNRRRNYYRFHTDRDWGIATNYSLTLNSGVLGEDTCVDIILKAMED